MVTGHFLPCFGRAVEKDFDLHLWLQLKLRGIFYRFAVGADMGIHQKIRSAPLGKKSAKRALVAFADMEVQRPVLAMGMDGLIAEAFFAFRVGNGSKTDISRNRNLRTAGYIGDYQMRVPMACISSTRARPLAAACEAAYCKK